MQMFEECL